LTIPTEDFFKNDPVALLRLFQVAQEHGLDIHPRALRAASQSLRLVDRLREDPEANRLFLDILTSRKDPETALRRMNEAGILGRFIPDFGRVVAQMQYDMYHHYTVDEHTLFAIGILHKIETGLLKEEHPLATDLAATIVSRRALYLAVLLHDIAKGRGGDHSEIGERIALELGPRLGLSAEETETVAWLVRWHLLMSGAAFKLDIGDPKTIGDFVERVQSPERLKLLLVLTVADIRAVGPNVWNGWKATLLRELYHRAIEVMSGGLTVEGGICGLLAQAAARRLLPISARKNSPPSPPAATRSIGCPSTPRPMPGTRLMREAESPGRRSQSKRRSTAIGDGITLHRRSRGPLLRIAARWRSAGQHRRRPDHDDVERMALDTFWVRIWRAAHSTARTSSPGSP
jgi:[protein-PII] uridylyltransferase